MLVRCWLFRIVHQVRPALERVLRHDGAALLEVRVNTHELVTPPSLEMEQVGGFALSMAKAAVVATS